MPREKSSVSRDCPCRSTANAGSSSSVLCPTCVSHGLQSLYLQREEALQKRNEAREACARELNEIKHRGNKSIAELADESGRLRDVLASLRQDCSSLAIQVASRVVENDERKFMQSQEGSSLPRQRLHRLEESLYSAENGALGLAFQSATERVGVVRFQWAIQVFAMHRLDADQPQEVQSENQQQSESATSKRRQQQQHHRHPRGIGKIGGLPLPNAGPELYGVLPAHELQSALRLVASLTSTVARCLGIVLPHPILLQPTGPKGDITEHGAEPLAQLRESSTKSITTNTISEPVGSSSTNSLMSLMGTGSWKKSAKKVLARATGQQPTTLLESTDGMHIPPSMDVSAVSLRIRHAASAVIAEDHSSSPSKYDLSCSSSTEEENFAIGLQLLQNNVVALCIRAGVPVATLWPAEALLLNLHALWVHCQEQVSHPSTS